MPRPNPPPTPASSNDIRGKEGAHAAPTFHLPPTAFQETDRASAGSETPSGNASDESYRPVSPTSPRGSEAVVTRALPPPPTRSRKIIQMMPGESEDGESTQQQQQPAKAQNGGGKKKQNGASTTAAGRKIARKTAHSLIERRRRSKMNEEFGVLKDMIPACQGQEMHKLSILQASIDYLRYLEQCVSDLQTKQTRAPAPPPPTARANDDDDDEEMNDDDNNNNENDHQPTTSAASATTERTPSTISLPPLSQITSAATTTTSPSIQGRHSSLSQPSFSPYIHSTQTSPAFGPQLPTSAREGFGLGSPALKPDRRSEQELDKEATAALLMLNHQDRRGGGGGGMSVRDLLSG